MAWQPLCGKTTSAGRRIEALMKRLLNMRRHVGGRLVRSERHANAYDDEALSSAW